ncbi:MAG: hypothetical protein J5858_07605 [Lentisphaeria bacterium]|nr:hypothetical protein [Lentisphaeria bacterium]
MSAAIPNGKMYNFFIDDNVFFFDDIYQHKFSSIFDNFYLSGLKRAHERFGTKFTLNTFYHNWHHPQFDLSLFPDCYRAEFEANSNWLKFAFHGQSEFPERPYSEAYPEKIAEHYEQWRNAICRIAGEETLIAPVIFHYFDAAPNAREFMRRQGMKFFAVRVDCNGAFNQEFDQYEIPVDIILNLFKADIAGIRSTLEQKIAAGQQKILIGSHEQYAYRHYKNYIPEYFDGLFAACEVMKKYGYEPVYFNELV